MLTWLGYIAYFFATVLLVFVFWVLFSTKMSWGKTLEWAEKRVGLDADLTISSTKYDELVSALETAWGMNLMLLIALLMMAVLIGAGHWLL